MASQASLLLQKQLKDVEIAIYPDGRVCISILHHPVDDPNGYKLASERWTPVHTNKDAGYVENQQQNIADAIDLLPRLVTGIDVNIQIRRTADFEFTRSNVLLLRNNLKLNPDIAEVAREKLLSLAAERLIDSNSNVNYKDAGYVENHRLATGIDVNKKFRRIADFEFTRECAIFDQLDIPLYHGWIVDPQVFLSSFTYAVRAGTGGEEAGIRAGDRAAAAMCVGMGSFSDPNEAQVLAHFLEHMLFMGSDEFPDENEVCLAM
ncbi:hypothetical protein VNO80_05131 [Phaseolus coccineus]|uniref:Peptidase M16 N-terminal domain-containing protein n=1 Tax=Phaseolus coccineus TaxID=3886 RepID=A0AAN9RPU9_PHACN